MVVVFAVTPLLYSNNRIASAVTSKQFFLIGLVDIMVIIWVWLMVKDSRYRLGNKNLILFIPATLLLISMGVSTVVGIDSYVSFFSTIERGGGLLFMMHMYVFALITASLVRVKGLEIVRTIFQAILFSAVGVAIMTFFTNEAFNIGVQWLNETVGGAMLGNSTIAGSYFVFALFGVAVLCFFETVTWKKFVYSIGLLILLFSPILFNIKGVFVTKTIWSGFLTNPLVIVGQARAAVGAIVIGAIISCLVYYMITTEKKWKKLSSGIIIGVIILGIGVIGFQVFKAESLIQKAFIKNVGENRLIFWNEAFNGIKEKPIFGWGPENFKVVHEKYFNPVLAGSDHGAEIWVDKPHNTLIEIIVTQGYVGLGVYLVFIIALFGTIGYLLTTKKIETKLGVLLIGVLISYMLQNQLAFDSVTSFMCFWLLVGIIAGYCDTKNVSSADSTRQHAWFITLAILITVLSSIIWLYAAYFPSRKMIAAKKIFDASVEARTNMYEELFSGSGSAQLNTDLGMIFYTLAESYLSQRDVISNDPRFVEVATKELQALVKVGESQKKVTQTNYRFALALAIFKETEIAINGKFTLEQIKDATQYVRNAIEISPTNPFAYLMYSKILLYTNQVEEARIVIDKAIALSPTIRESHIQKNYFERAFGSYSQQQEALKTAKKYFPGFEVQ
jgi:O-antigen ligase